MYGKRQMGQPWASWSSDSSLQLYARAELSDTLGLDLDRRTSLRVSPISRFALIDVEAAESRQRDMIAALERIADGANHGLQGSARLCFVETCVDTDALNEIRLVHVCLSEM